MSHASPQPDRLALLAEQDFVRSIVRQLLKGQDGEDDLVQRTWLRSLGRAPIDSDRRRPWLARIARNLVRDHQRNSQRRVKWEQAAAQAEALPSTSDVLAREAERQRLVEAVLRLEEPSRSTLLLRYWDDLSTPEIARCQKIPQATVRSRLKRGLDQLRSELDGEYGDRKTWIVALTPLMSRGTTWTVPLTLGAAFMSIRPATFAFVAVTLLGCVGMWVLTDNPDLSGRDDIDPASKTVVLEGSADIRSPDSAPELALRTAVTNAGFLLVTGSVRHLRKTTPITAMQLRIETFAGLGVHGTAKTDVIVRSDNEGQFELKVVRPDQSVTLFVTPVDIVRYKGSATAIVTPGEGPHQISLELAFYACKVTGFVRDAEEEPIEGATVHYGDASDHFTQSDSSGRYALFVPAQSIGLGCYADGHAGQLTPIVISEGCEHFDHDIVLQAGSSLSGTIRDEDGHGFQNARVTVWSCAFQPVFSDVNGDFEISHLDSSQETYRVHAKHSSYQQGGATARSDSDVTIVLALGYPVSGLVQNEYGKPIEAAAIYVRTSALANGKPDGYSDRDGQFRIEGMSDGPCRLAAKKPGYAIEFAQVDIGSDDQEPVIMRMQPSWSVTGRVCDQAGQPVKGAKVLVFRANSESMANYLGLKTRTDASGRFVCDQLPEVACSVLVIKDGYMRKQVSDVNPGASGIDVQLQRIGRVVCRIVDGASGKPISQFKIRSRTGTGGSRYWTRAQIIREPEGRWETEDDDIPFAAQIDLEIMAKGYATQRLMGVIASSDAQKEEHVIRMQPGVTLQGLVRTADGKVAAGVKIVLASKSDHGALDEYTTLEAQSDRSGHYELASLPREVFYLVLYHKGYPRCAVGPFRVGSTTQVKNLDISLHRGVTLKGRLVGFPSARRVSLIPQVITTDPEFRTADVDERGCFEVHGLHAGQYDVSPIVITADDTEPEEVSATVEISTEEPVEVEVRARDGDRKLSGRVLGASSGYVHLVPKSGWTGARPMKRSIPIEDSRFSTEGLAACVYQAVVMSEDGHDAQLVDLTRVKAVEIELKLKDQ